MTFLRLVINDQNNTGFRLPAETSKVSVLPQRPYKYMYNSQECRIPNAEQLDCRMSNVVRLDIRMSNVVRLDICMSNGQCLGARHSNVNCYMSCGLTFQFPLSNV